jgi:hypothetical protein
MHTPESLAREAVSHTPQVYMHGGRDGNGPPRHGGKEIEGHNEQERIENDGFTSRVFAGDVKYRQDHRRTTKTISTVHVKTLDVPFDSAQRLT